MSKSPSGSNDSFKVHELADKIGKEVSRGGGAIRIKGYIGRSDNADTVLLYLNLNFDEYVLILKKDILHVADAPESELEMGGTYLWVKKDSQITHVKTDSTSQQAQYLEGDIARAQVKPTTDAQTMASLGYSDYCGSGKLCLPSVGICPSHPCQPPPSTSQSGCVQSALYQCHGMEDYVIGMSLRPCESGPLCISVKPNCAEVKPVEAQAIGPIQVSVGGTCPRPSIQWCSMVCPSRICSMACPSHALCSIACPSFEWCSMACPSHALCSIACPSGTMCGGPMSDPTNELRSQISKLQDRLKKLEEEK
ncbi:MAG: hypothetical protein KGH85_05235 [Thaumarchaeota archaeon]|nr:hypothetical protein [Nitrososphaerota archaeon]